MSDLSQQPLTRALIREHTEAFRMFRDAVNRLDDEQWGKGEPSWTEVPARIALHILYCADFYISPGNDQYLMPNRDVQWWIAPIDELPDRQQTLAWIDKIEQATVDYLKSNGDVGLLNEKAASARREQTRVEWLTYALRHLSHHVAQLSAECKRRGLGAADWG